VAARSSGRGGVEKLTVMALEMVVWALVCACSTTSAFNVDLSTASLRQGDADSMFGFSVAQHVDHQQSWLVAATRCSSFLF